jgi:hypothetical protein
MCTKIKQNYLSSKQDGIAVARHPKNRNTHWQKRAGKNVRAKPRVPTPPCQRRRHFDPRQKRIFFVSGFLVAS